MARRMLAWLMILMLFGAARAEEAYVVCMKGICALVDGAGESLIEGEAVDSLYEVRPGSLYAAGTKGGYALYDAGGARLTEARFDLIADAGDCLIFREGDGFGAMDSAGKVIVEPGWTQLVSNGAGGFLMLMDSPLDAQADEIFYQPPEGEAQATGVFTLSGLRMPGDGLMAYAAADGRWGYLDGQGYAALPSDWMYAGDFGDGLAIVSDGESMGAIDRSGEAIIPLRYAWIGRGDGVIAGLGYDGSVDVYSNSGSLRYALKGPAEQVSVIGGCVVVVGEDGAAACDADGNRISSLSRDAVFAPGTRGQLIAADGEWGEACQYLVDPNGSEASGRFQRILPLCPGRYAFIEMPGVEYYSEELGMIKTSWDYTRARYGLMDDRGSVLLGAEYLEIRAAGDDQLLLDDGEYVAFADRDGNPVRTWAYPAE